MTEASIGEFYESREYRNDNIIILHVASTHPTTTGKCSMYAIKDLANFMNVTFTFGDFDQSGGSTGAALLLAKSGVSGTPASAVRVLPSSLWPTADVNQIINGRIQVSAITYEFCFTATYSSDGLIYIKQQERYVTLPSEHIFFPNADVQSATSIILPPITFRYPTT